jgi:DNA-binding MarR family transcriptional regulator
VAVSDGEIFLALAHEEQRRILERLLRSDASQAEIRTDLDMRSGTASKHLKVLEDAGLVTRNYSHGRYRVVLPSMVLEVLRATAGLADSLAREQAERAASRLKELRKLEMSVGADARTRDRKAE